MNELIKEVQCAFNYKQNPHRYKFIYIKDEEWMLKCKIIMDKILKIVCWFVILAVPLVSANQSAMPHGGQMGGQMGGQNMMMYHPGQMSRFARPQNMQFVPQQQAYSPNGQYVSNGQFGSNGGQMVSNGQFSPSGGQFRSNYAVMQNQGKQSDVEEISGDVGQADYARYSQGSYAVEPSKQYQGYYQPKAGYSKDDYSDIRKQGRNDVEYVVRLPDGTSHRVEYNEKEDKFYPTGQEVLQVGDREKGGAQFLYDPRSIEALNSYNKNQQNQYQHERPQSQYQGNTNDYYNQPRY